ncbi:MAG: cyclic nucleotide-binding domain-containing protein [Thermodesulfobacteriota bacterium]|nr:cyclic nucleotide-binding domain-containing protein [Thermodesulfobacteriota bacterium]
MQDNSSKESPVKEPPPEEPSAKEAPPEEPAAEEASSEEPASKEAPPKEAPSEEPAAKEEAPQKPSSIDLLVKRLNQIPHLSVFSDEELKERFLPMSKVRVFKPGDIISKEGIVDPWIYFIISGQVKIMKHGKTISVLKRCGEVFGEMSVIEEAEASCTVIALTDTTCLAMDSSLLEKLDKEERDSFLVILYRIFSEILTERLRLANSEVMKLREENEQLRKALGAAAGDKKPDPQTS